MAFTIKQVAVDSEIMDCFAVMLQLRPHLTRETFLARARSQMQEGYHLACAMKGETVIAVAGYRFSQSLSWGKYLYVDDLVTDAAKRSQGAGKALLQWLIAEAKRHDCAELHLDSGIQRKDAHRFYEREGMELLGYHYKIAVV